MPLRPVVRLLPSSRLIVALRGVMVCMVVVLPDWTSSGERVRAVNRGNSDLLSIASAESHGFDVVVVVVGVDGVAVVFEVVVGVPVGVVEAGVEVDEVERVVVVVVVVAAVKVDGRVPVEVVVDEVVGLDMGVVVVADDPDGSGVADVDGVDVVVGIPPEEEAAVIDDVVVVGGGDGDKPDAVVVARDAMLDEPVGGTDVALVAPLAAVEVEGGDVDEEVEAGAELALLTPCMEEGEEEEEEVVDDEEEPLSSPVLILTVVVTVKAPPLVGVEVGGMMVGVRVVD